MLYMHTVSLHIEEKCLTTAQNDFFRSIQQKANALFDRRHKVTVVDRAHLMLHERKQPFKYLRSILQTIVSFHISAISLNLIFPFTSRTLNDELSRSTKSWYPFEFIAVSNLYKVSRSKT